jgi:hypothetical protein
MEVKDSKGKELYKKDTDDGEADYLGNQMRPVHPKGPGNLFNLPATVCKQEKSVHIRTSNALVYFTRNNV